MYLNVNDDDGLGGEDQDDKADRKKKGVGSFSSFSFVIYASIPYGQSSAKLPVILSPIHLAFGHLIIQSFSHSVAWSLGHLVTQSLGHSVTTSGSPGLLRRQ